MRHTFTDRGWWISVRQYTVSDQSSGVVQETELGPLSFLYMMTWIKIHNLKMTSRLNRERGIQDNIKVRYSKTWSNNIWLLRDVETDFISVYKRELDRNEENNLQKYEELGNGINEIIPWGANGPNQPSYTVIIFYSPII